MHTETNNLTYLNVLFNPTDGEEQKVGTVVATMPQIIIERVHPDAVIPTYASEGDSGMDVYAVEDIMFVHPSKTVKARLGFKMEIPKHPLHELGYRWECQARPRSGISANTMLRVANAPGTIDNFYRGELAIILTNTASAELAWEYGEAHAIQSNYAINLKGERVLTSISDEEPNAVSIVPEGTIIIRKGDRIAQLVFNEVIRPMSIVEGTVGTSDRGEGGFGSTGI